MDGTVTEPTITSTSGSPSLRRDDDSPHKLTRDPLKSRRPDEEASQLSRPSKIVLDRPDYYTIPPIDEIDDLESGGQCIVEGFTIGRRGFGQVHYPGKTDVYGLDLDNLGTQNSLPFSSLHSISTPFSSLHSMFLGLNNLVISIGAVGYLYCPNPSCGKPEIPLC